MDADNGTDTTVLRRTRALSDLSRQLAGVSVVGLAVTPNTVNNQFPTAMMTPAASPDEMVIQLRGRKNPVTWSPLSINGVLKLSQCDVTPTKDSTPTRSSQGLRSSPRKRLQLYDVKETSTNTSPDKWKKALPSVAKRPKLGGVKNVPPLDFALKGLSHTQLIEVVLKVASGNAQLKEELESTLPEPDLQPIREKLMYFRKNVFRSLPNSRLSSKTDAAAYCKAALHLSTLKKCVIDYGKQLVESEQWNSVIDYTIIAWDVVKSTPVWDNPQHNSARNCCFKILAAGCLKAIKGIVGWSADHKAMLKLKLERLRGDCEDMDFCLNCLDSAI